MNMVGMIFMRNNVCYVVLGGIMLKNYVYSNVDVFYFSV